MNNLPFNNLIKIFKQSAGFLIDSPELGRQNSLVNIYRNVCGDIGHTALDRASSAIKEAIKDDGSILSSIFVDPKDHDRAISVLRRKVNCVVNQLIRTPNEVTNRNSYIDALWQTHLYLSNTQFSAKQRRLPISINDSHITERYKMRASPTSPFGTENGSFVIDIGLGIMLAKVMQDKLEDKPENQVPVFLLFGMFYDSYETGGLMLGSTAKHEKEDFEFTINNSRYCDLVRFINDEKNVPIEITQGHTDWTPETSVSFYTVLGAHKGMHDDEMDVYEQFRKLVRTESGELNLERYLLIIDFIRDFMGLKEGELMKLTKDYNTELNILLNEISEITESDAWASCATHVATKGRSALLYDGPGLY